MMFIFFHCILLGMGNTRYFVVSMELEKQNTYILLLQLISFLSLLLLSLALPFSFVFSSKK